MDIERKPFQGLLNIIRFNWHFYLLSGVFLVLLFLSMDYFPALMVPAIYGVMGAVLVAIITSLFASYYIYDRSDLYDFNYLEAIDNRKTEKVLNISAGFDETSRMLKSKFNKSELVIFDFYDPEKHTEVSIKRARRAYPSPLETISVKTEKLPLPNNSVELAFVILSAHEIREEQERIKFFQELRRLTKVGGKIYVTEHLRDLNNFLVFNIGAFHFYSHSSWLWIFQQAQLKVIKEVKTTPFISTFILEHDGTTP